MNGQRGGPLASVLRILTSPLSLIDRDLGRAVSQVATFALTLVNPLAGALYGAITSYAFKKPGAGASPADRDRLLATINPRALRTIVFGRTAMATDIQDQEFTGTNQEYMHRFIVCASHKVQSIEEVWFDDKLAWSVGGGVQGEYVGYLTVAPVLEGSAANAINISPRMGSTRRYTGLAYVHFRYKLTGNNKKTESPFASSVPSRITIIGKGVPVYDPRLDSTVGGVGPQRADDQSTWVWNDSACRNPALQALTFMLGWRINGLLAIGKGIPARRFDMGSFITAANICDEPVALAGGGTEPRYRSDGIFNDGDDLQSVLAALALTMDARFYDPQGRIAVKCMVNDLAMPVATFTENDILGAVDWKPFGPLDGQYNIVRGTYTDASSTSLYQSVDYPEDSTTSTDGVNRVYTLDLPLVQSVSQAQRLARRARLRAEYGGGRLACEMQATAWRCEQYSPVSLSFPALSMAGKSFRVEEIEARLDGTVPIVLAVEDARIYAWGAEDVVPAAPVVTTPYDPANNPLLQGITESSIGVAIASSYTSGLSGNITQANNGSGAITVTIPAHSRVYPSPYGNVSVTGGTLTFAYSEFGMIYYDDHALAGGAVTYGKTAVSADAYFSAAHPYRHFIGYVTANNASGTGGGTGGSSPPGGGGWSGSGGGPIP